MSAPPALANVLRPHGDFAIIGPGGGVDVLRAGWRNGSPSVTGIEINPIIANTIMRERYAGYAYHLYERPEVHIHVTDGRSYLRSTPQRFDVVQMTLVDTWASTAAGAFAFERKQSLHGRGFPGIFRAPQTGRHDRHHALGIPPTARSIAGGSSGDGRVAQSGRGQSGAQLYCGFARAAR